MAPTNKMLRAALLASGLVVLVALQWSIGTAKAASEDGAPFRLVKRSTDDEDLMADYDEESPRSLACPRRCPGKTKVVCGTDGLSHKNECEVMKLACETGSDIKVAHVGECKKPPPDLNRDDPDDQSSGKNCPKEEDCDFEIVDYRCCDDGKGREWTILNDCVQKSYECLAGRPYKILHKGECKIKPKSSRRPKPRRG